MRKIKPFKYYVVNLEDMLKPFLFNTEYLTAFDAERIIIHHLGFDFTKYNVLKGSQALRYRVPIKLGKIGNLPIGEKYIYPTERVAWQKKKTYRTIMRRKLRKRLLEEQLNTINP